MKFQLPEDIKHLVAARQLLRDRFGSTGLKFTFDGNLVGDIGEAIASELFGIKLVGPGNRAIDGHAADGRSVQVKASGTGRGPAFQWSKHWAHHLIFFGLNFDECSAEVLYNGPLSPVRNHLPEQWVGPRFVSIKQVRTADGLVRESDRLRPLESWRP